MFIESMYLSSALDWDCLFFKDMLVCITVCACALSDSWMSCELGLSCIYSLHCRPSLSQTLMTRVPGLFRTRS